MAERDAATAVAGLRRLGLPDWALNVVAGEDPDAVAEFVDAADEVREAQAAAIEGRPGADVRVVLQELRERTARLVALARGVLDRAGQTSTTASTGELTARLASIAGNATAAGQLRAGLLGAEDPGTSELFAGLLPAAGPSRRPAKATKATKATKAAERAPRPRSRRPGPLRRAPIAMRRWRAARRVRALAAAEREQATANKALSAAETAVEKSAAALDKARSRFELAEAELARAQQHHDDAERDRDEAAGAVAAAERSLTEAQAAVDADR